jgi:hypothetical protein
MLSGAPVAEHATRHAVQVQHRPAVARPSLVAIDVEAAQRTIAGDPLRLSAANTCSI